MQIASCNLRLNYWNSLKANFSPLSLTVWVSKILVFKTFLAQELPNVITQKSALGHYEIVQPPKFKTSNYYNKIQNYL